MQSNASRPQGAFTKSSAGFVWFWNIHKPCAAHCAINNESYRAAHWITLAERAQNLFMGTEMRKVHDKNGTRKIVTQLFFTQFPVLLAKTSTQSDLTLPLWQVPLWTHLNQISKHVSFQNNTPAMFSVPQCCLPSTQVSVCCLLKLCVN